MIQEANKGELQVIPKQEYALQPSTQKYKQGTAMRNYTGLSQGPIIMLRTLHGHLSQSQRRITQLQMGTSKENNILMSMPLSYTNTMWGTFLLQPMRWAQGADFNTFICPSDRYPRTVSGVSQRIIYRIILLFLSNLSFSYQIFPLSAIHLFTSQWLFIGM